MIKGKKSNKILRAAELFAGVGGFRIGLDRASSRNKRFETVWANQWEPSSGKIQHAAWVYEQAFFRSRDKTEAEMKKGFSNIDINKVVNSDVSIADDIPPFDLLTGGFPCQDYSVARPLSQAAGLKGKKGVLWWSIYEILRHRIDSSKEGPVPYLFLENVDRLLKSPASNRGRDFAIMLSTLSELGYVVEWRVINAGEYGLPQRRRRTYIVGYHKTTRLAQEARAAKNHLEWVLRSGVVAKAFPVEKTFVRGGFFGLSTRPEDITKRFVPLDPEVDVDFSAPFQNAGLMIEGRVHTAKTSPVFHGKPQTLGDILQPEDTVPKQFYIPASEVKKWEQQKAAHRFERTHKDGHKYLYVEGRLPFPDPLDKPSRTIITSEGGRSSSRFKHVIGVRQRPGYPKGRTIDGQTYLYRRLTPIELERLCMFEDDHTRLMFNPLKQEISEVPDTKRAFFMGNALVVGVITKIGRELLKRV
ncbi:MAG: DNA (cytosine-5-)-methyltransferase [Patescibacteria group bacterium]|jgi:DNA (cytosine-5)-methyltransferase 1